MILGKYCISDSQSQGTLLSRMYENDDDDDDDIGIGGGGSDNHGHGSGKWQR